MSKCISKKKEVIKIDKATKKQGLLRTVEKVPISPSQKEHYGNLDNTQKKITQPDGGFFAFPHATKGETKSNIRKTIVFYFNTEEEYETATKFFDKNKSLHKLPYMDTNRLMKLLVDQGNEGNE